MGQLFSAVGTIVVAWLAIPWIFKAGLYLFPIWADYMKWVLQ